MFVGVTVNGMAVGGTSVGGTAVGVTVGEIEVGGGETIIAVGEATVAAGLQAQTEVIIRIKITNLTGVRNIVFSLPMHLKNYSQNPQEDLIILLFGFVTSVDYCIWE
jgi:hypothetical protein